MELNLFTYLSYRQYLKDRLEALGPKSGLKRRAAESIGVHTTFISQVAVGKADLSLDQAEKINSFLNHSEEEGDFFLDLVIFERAGDQTLKRRFENKIKNKLLARSEIKNRFKETKEIQIADQEKFYSTHLYGLLHVLTSIPRYRTIKNLSEITGYSTEIITRAIDFLLSIKVLKRVKDQIIPGEQHVHLSKNSKNIWRHHTNWRLATIQRMEMGDQSDLHYSLTFSCSEKDAHRIRESLLSHLRLVSQIIDTSKEEDIFVYCFDFFKWK